MPKPFTLSQIVCRVEPGPVAREGLTACIDWTGTRLPHGYGRLKWHGADHYAHRFFYELHHGVDTTGWVVRHRCDRPMCVNVDHLAIGTTQDNQRDAHHRDRASVGESHYNAKLSDEDVRAIRASTESRTVLGQRYGVTRAHIYQVQTGRRRKRR